MLVSKDTRWKPDSCGCVILYDAQLIPPAADPEIINHRFEHSCAEHASIPLYKDRFEAVLAKNRGR